ncbi:TPA: hypothetical protein ACJJDK_002039, partial [Neisseria meningitidis]
IYRKKQKPLRRHSRTGFVIPAQASSFPHLLIHYISAVFYSGLTKTSTALPRLAVLSVLSAASSPYPDFC